MMSKKIVYYKLVTGVKGIATNIPSFSGLVTKTYSIIHTNRVFRKRSKIWKKRYPILVVWSRRLITTQKLEVLKTRYLVLLL